MSDKKMRSIASDIASLALSFTTASEALATDALAALAGGAEAHAKILAHYAESNAAASEIANSAKDLAKAFASFVAVANEAQLLAIAPFAAAASVASITITTTADHFAAQL